MGAWATVEELKEWMDLPANAGDDATLTQCLTVAQSHMVQRLDADLLTEAAIPPAEVPEDVKLALLMRANSLYRRRQTPEGVQGVGDFAVIRVGRTDPDVERLEGPYRAYGFT